MTANFDENPPSGECQLSGVIQGTSRRIKNRGSKTSRSRGSERVEGRKNTK